MRNRGASARSTSTRWRPVLSRGLAGLCVAGIVFTVVFAARHDGRAGDQPSAAPATLPSTTTTLGPTTTTTDPGPASRLRQPSRAVLPPLPADGLAQGATGDTVLAFQQRLADLRIDPGDVDGNFGLATFYAVETVQKLMGITPTGVLGEPERQFLATFRYPEPLHPDAEPDRTEISVTKQLLTLYSDGQVRLITTASTGSGEHYCYDTPKADPVEHICEVANTPSGRFEFYFHYSGWQDGDVGAMYNPFYFNRGIAVHGLPNVPIYPASHGCSRVPMHIAEYFYTLVKIGDPVYVDGGTPVVIESRTPIVHEEPATAPPSTEPSTPSSTSTTKPSGPTTTTT